MPRVRFPWALALGLGGVAYLALVLFDDLESPLFSLVLIVLVAYELIRSHRGKVKMVPPSDLVRGAEARDRRAAQ